MLNDALFGSVHVQQQARKEAAAYYDHMLHTHLFANFSNWQLSNYLIHECKDGRMSNVHGTNNLLPRLVNNQQLHNLRHKKGCVDTKGCIAKCHKCKQDFTMEELVTCLMVRGVGLLEPGKAVNDTLDDRILWERMCTSIVAQQKKRSVQPLDVKNKAIVAATYQHHLACHIKGCINCSKSAK